MLPIAVISSYQHCQHFGVEARHSWLAIHDTMPTHSLDDSLRKKPGAVQNSESLCDSNLDKGNQRLRCAHFQPALKPGCSSCMTCQFKSWVAPATLKLSQQQVLKLGSDVKSLTTVGPKLHYIGPVVLQAEAKYCHKQQGTTCSVSGFNELVDPIGSQLGKSLSLSLDTENDKRSAGLLLLVDRYVQYLAPLLR